MATGPYYYRVFGGECKDFPLSGRNCMKEKICNSRPIKWLSGLRISRYFCSHPFFGRFCNYEMITYLIAGVLTTLVNYLVYFLMPRFGTKGLDIILAQIVAWIAAVAFAYVVNKIFVFDSPSWKREVVLRELVPFVVCRLTSLGLETAFIYVMVALLHINETLMKIIASIFVLLINYFASKFLVFRRRKK